MRHPFITAQLLRQAPAADITQAGNRPAQSTVLSRRVPRQVVWSATTLLAAAVAALSILLPAGTALGGEVNERGDHHAYRHDAHAAHQQPIDAGEQFRRGERASQEQSTTAEAVEKFRRGERASQQQPIDNPTPAPTPLRPAEPSGQPGWVIVSIAALAVLLAGLAMVVRRANRRARVGQAA
jgi:hypothetical protein